MRVLNAKQLSAALSHADCIAALEPAMRAVSAGDVIQPLRQYMQIPHTAGKFTTMPGYLGQPRSFGVKLVAKYPREPGSELGSHVGAVMIFEADSGVPYALLDGAELTAIRTAAASALATKYLSRSDAKHLTVLGTGTQAQHHIAAIRAVRTIESVTIWGRNRIHAHMLSERIDDVDTRVVDSVEDAIASADIVCTTTAATEPILFGRWLRPGLHLNLVGAAVGSAREVDTELVTRSRFYIDYWPSVREQAGELRTALAENAIGEDHVVGELGQLLVGSIEGRRDDRDITTYKSLGVAAQDLAAAHRAVENAEHQGLGQTIDWP